MQGRHLRAPARLCQSLHGPRRVFVALARLSGFADCPRLPDDNRGFLLEAGFPQTVLGLLESFAESVKPAQRTPAAFTVPDLKIVKTAIWFILNASVGYGE